MLKDLKIIYAEENTKLHIALINSKKTFHQEKTNDQTNLLFEDLLNQMIEKYEKTCKTKKTSAPRIIHKNASSLFLCFSLAEEILFTDCYKNHFIPLGKTAKTINATFNNELNIISDQRIYIDEIKKFTEIYPVIAQILKVLIKTVNKKSADPNYQYSNRENNVMTKSMLKFMESAFGNNYSQVVKNIDIPSIFKNSPSLARSANNQENDLLFEIKFKENSNELKEFQNSLKNLSIKKNNNGIHLINSEKFISQFFPELSEKFSNNISLESSKELNPDSKKI
jgi:hypothetical protein